MTFRIPGPPSAAIARSIRKSEPRTQSAILFVLAAVPSSRPTLVGAVGFVVQQVAGRRYTGKPPADHRCRNPPAVGGADLAGGVADRYDVLPDGLRYGAGNGDETGLDVAADPASALT